MLVSSNIPAFTDKLSQLISKTLEINWKLHCILILIIYTHSQSAGKIEIMNRTLNDALIKQTLKTGVNWVDLPFVLLGDHCMPNRENVFYIR